MRNYIDAARVTGRKNLDGRLAVKATAGLPFMLEEGMEVHFVPPQIDVPRQATVESVSELQGYAAVVSVTGVRDASTADALAGCHVLVAADDLDIDAASLTEQGECHPLVGWTLEDETSGVVAKVVFAEDMPSQTMLTVERTDGEEGVSLVPLVDGFVLDADEEGRFMKVELPKGIFEL